MSKPLTKADITELLGMRGRLRKSLGVKITTNAFYIRALALAVKKYPLMVGSIVRDNIKIADSINVGFGVNAPQGLVVPVVKNADKKSGAAGGRARDAVPARDESAAERNVADF